MTAREVLQIGEPALRRRAAEIPPEAIGTAATQTLIDDLIDTMRAERGAGIAANQVGEALRVCVIEVGDNPRYPYKPRIPLTVLVNPRLEPLGEERFENYEGCLSVPGLRGVVSRHAGIRVRAWDREGNELVREVWGLSAGTYQHECDHLDGVLFVDRVSDPRTLCTWEAFERHHRDAFVEYVGGLVERYGS